MALEVSGQCGAGQGARVEDESEEVGDCRFFGFLAQIESGVTL